MTAYMTLKKYGWQQGRFGDRRIGFCAVGALCSAYPNFAKRIAAKKRLAETIGIPTNSIVEWNDEKGRRKSQVLSIFKKARV